MDALKVDYLVDYICITDELGRELWKPHPISYLLLLEKFNLKAQECIYIGDNELKDFITAKSIGMQTIKIERVNGIYRESSLKFKRFYQADKKYVRYGR